jgi:WD40 repeat protein
MLALGLRDGWVYLLDSNTGSEYWRVHAHPGSNYTGVSVSPNSKCVATTGMGRQIKIWNSMTGTLSMLVPPHDGSDECTCGVDGPINAFLCSVGPTRNLLAVKFSPCGNFIACTSRGQIWLWQINTDTRQSRLQWCLDTPAVELDNLSFSADTAILSCGGYQIKTYIIDIASGLLIRTWEATAGGNICPTNSNMLITGGKWNTKMWDIDTQTERWSFMAGQDLEEAKNFAVFSLDGLTVATVGQDRPDYNSSDDETLDEYDDDSIHPPPFVRLVDAMTGETKAVLDHDWYSDLSNAAFSVCSSILTPDTPKIKNYQRLNTCDNS